MFNTYFAVEPSSALIPTVALVDFACNELGHRKSDLLDGAILLSQSCERWWPFATKAIMCERPHKYAIDQAELLHCEDGKAIEYPDGWGVYCWHGTLVPEHVILRPETITADDITNEENVEVRRVMLRRFGEERYIKTVGAHIVATDAVGQLVEAPLPGDESLKMVRVRNSTPEPDGSHRHYWLRVPPTMMTPRQAVAWSFNLKEQHYRPSKET